MSPASRVRGLVGASYLRVEGRVAVDTPRTSRGNSHTKHVPGGSREVFRGFNRVTIETSFFVVQYRPRTILNVRPSFYRNEKDLWGQRTEFVLLFSVTYYFNIHKLIVLGMKNFSTYLYM